MSRRGAVCLCIADADEYWLDADDTADRPDMADLSDLFEERVSLVDVDLLPSSLTVPYFANCSKCWRYLCLIYFAGISFCC